MKPDIRTLRDDTGRLLASFNVLFETPSNGALETNSFVHRPFLKAYARLIQCIRDELSAGDDGLNGTRYHQVLDSDPDSIDYFNHLVRTSEQRPFAARLRECIWDAVRRHWPAGEFGEDGAADAQLRHVLDHAARMFALGLEVPERYFAALARSAGNGADEGLARVDPKGLGTFPEGNCLTGLPETGLTAEFLGNVLETLKQEDVFSLSRTFRLRPGGETIPQSVGDIRPLSSFYGYKAERRFFTHHFSDFAEGKGVPPLLLHGLPGVGKTHLTISYALSFPEITLINGHEKQLEEDLEATITLLGRHHYRRFVLFFDDVDPENVEWSTFRHQVDGYLPYAQNVALVTASNYDFPARIQSRCLVFDFREMDPDVCQELIADFLYKHKGIRCEDEDLLKALVATVACDYVNEYRNGPLNELTPRSLVRYFAMLNSKPNRMRSLIAKSDMGILQLPDEDIFIQSNKLLTQQVQEEREN